MESSGNNGQSQKHRNHPHPDPSKPRAPRKETYDKHAPKNVLPKKYERQSGTCQKGEYPCPVIVCKASMFTRKYALVEHMGRTKGHKNDHLAEDSDQKQFRLIGPKPAGQLGTGPFITWASMQSQGPAQGPEAGSLTAMGPAATGNAVGNNGYEEQESSAFDNSAESFLPNTQAYSAQPRQHSFSSYFDMDKMPPSYASQLPFPGSNSFPGAHGFLSGNAFLNDRSYSRDNNIKSGNNLSGDSNFPDDEYNSAGKSYKPYR